MEKTRKKPFILEICTSPISFNLFTEANKLLEAIQVIQVHSWLNILRKGSKLT